jgi:hypothetical protein
MTDEHAKLLADDEKASRNLTIALNCYFTAIGDDKAEAESILKQAAAIAAKAHAALEAHPKIWDRAYWANYQATN